MRALLSGGPSSKELWLTWFEPVGHPLPHLPLAAAAGAGHAAHLPEDGAGGPGPVIAPEAPGDPRDEVWDAAQRQLVTEGRMPNSVRMLWGKRVLT